MKAKSRQAPRLFIRVAFYVLVATVVFMIRGQRAHQGVGFRFPTESDTTRTIALTGRELAPQLVPTLISKYRDQFPYLRFRVADGGTVRAVEALANRRASIGLLYRPPTGEEQAAVFGAIGDSVLYYPVALGGIVVLRNAHLEQRSFEMKELRGLATGDSPARGKHVYFPDPNDGLWEAFLQALGLPLDTGKVESVVFLENPEAVIRAVANDPMGLGVASTLWVSDGIESDSVRVVPVVPDTTSVPVSPGYEEIGYGEYPLHHYLYVACLSNGGIRSSMFVTYLTSDDGQRQVERAGFLPARRPMRLIHLTRQPVGTSH